jgi:antitoxin (DNA-binding transcriptional repressor) of toxin-antitoxin stability system
MSNRVHIKGREVVITEQGHPVAKLVPRGHPRSTSAPNLASFRRRMPVFDPPLSTTIVEDRTDRV